MTVFASASKQSDEDLMSRAQAGDDAAFAQLYDRHATRALRVAQAVCHNAARSEEVVQEGFLSIWRYRANYRPELGSFQSWSMKIIHRRAIDSARSEAAHSRRVLAVEDQPVPELLAASTSEQAIARIEGDSLQASLQWLPEAQADVIKLAFYGGLSHSEIASHLALPHGTVKGRMRLGLDKLRHQSEASDRTQPSTAGTRDGEPAPAPEALRGSAMRSPAATPGG